ncbi:neuropilin-2-like [Montipora foliosa]|uniref:neuropilin-2-like n=1 Tax=Montipora foliosa TaxID=591990 RepID=UPI0035F188B9
MAAQEQAFATSLMKARIYQTQKDSKCRMCRKVDESINHIVSECPKLAQKEYKRRHDWLGDCIDWDLGMENGLIPNKMITASSSIDTPASFGRLNDGRDSWCARRDNANKYLQIDLQSLHVICAVSTQGRRIYPNWVTKYTLQLSTDNKTWTDYKENGLLKIFHGNNDQNTAKKNVLSNVLITRWLRFVVKDYVFEACMRTEVYGVKQKPENIVAGKSTTQSSIYSDQYSNGTSDKAVDGNPDQEFKNGHCLRTLKDNPSWWRMDLSSPVQVFEVRIVIGNSPSSDGSNVTRNQVYYITLGERNTCRNLPLKHSELSHKLKNKRLFKLDSKRIIRLMSCYLL